AAKDQRFTVIHQPNAGIAGARNAAYPFIKGEYTLFVDDDDTIEPDLCEKTVAVADAEQTDTTYFLIDNGQKRRRDNKRLYLWGHQVAGLIGKDPLIENDYLILLRYPFIWAKLWRTCFLLDNDIRCPTGQYCEDDFMNWKTLVHHPKIALLPKVMYHHRNYSLSTSHEPSKKYLMGVPATLDLIKEMLLETGNYHGMWKRLFLQHKILNFRATYSHLPVYRQAEFLRSVKDRIGWNEQEYLLQKNKLKRHVRVFYYSLMGSRFAAVENTFYIALRKTEILFRKYRDKLLKRAG
ncbi:MAG: glycosyltransferase, partial [Planctomycetaceae bacterium]|nr:glycosyltransferase [Planctomycetaceae bacterium]